MSQGDRKQINMWEQVVYYFWDAKCRMGLQQMKNQSGNVLEVICLGGAGLASRFSDFRSHVFIALTRQQIHSIHVVTPSTHACGR